MLPMPENKGVTPFRNKFLAGFSLIEVIVALFVLGISLILVMEMFIIGTRGSVFPKNIAIIENLARTKIEEIKNLNFSQVNPGDPESDEKRDKSTDAFLPPEIELGYVNYDFTESDDYADDGSSLSLNDIPPRVDVITQVKDTENDWLRKIVVTLFYKEKGERRYFQLVSYKGNVEERE